MKSDLFEFAYIPRWYDQLYDLASMALPESWRFREPSYITKNDETPILERYINYIFHKQYTEYSYEDNPIRADQLFYKRNEVCCFHTGLLNRQYKSIYAYFERNKKKDTLLDWHFKGFVDETSPFLRYIEPLPQKPGFLVYDHEARYHSEWPIRVNTAGILGDAAQLARLPGCVGKNHGLNAALLLETAVELMRRHAEIVPSIIVPQIYQGRLRYLLPLYLSTMKSVECAVPDLALTLSPMEDGYYLGHTCLTLEMALANARVLARPTAAWLVGILDKPLPCCDMSTQDDDILQFA